VNFQELEAEALKLDLHERAKLAETLLQSLDALSDAELDRLWAEEAQRRDDELEADQTVGRRAEEVLREARARLR
jgi:broad specificity phosphatase PhoE